MKFYVVRHGQTDWNAKGRIQGKTDIELNEIGIEQARQLKALIKDYNIDLIISSPLKRARKTAEIINETVKCNIIFEDSLKERGYGIFEGMIRKEINDEDELYDLCIDNGWNLQWYEKYKKHLNKWTSY